MQVAEGVDLAYRLYKPADGLSPEWLVLHFHANAELCTTIGQFSANFSDLRYAAQLTSHLGWVRVRVRVI